MPCVHTPCNWPVSCKNNCAALADNVQTLALNVLHGLPMPPMWAQKLPVLAVTLPEPRMLPFFESRLMALPGGERAVLRQGLTGRDVEAFRCLHRRRAVDGDIVAGES